MRVKVSPSAEKDLNDICGFYEKQSAGIGDYFLATLSSDILALRMTAGIHSKRGNLFRTKSEKFPHWIYYVLKENVVYVLMGIDARQNPSKIQQREKREEKFL